MDSWPRNLLNILQLVLELHLLYSVTPSWTLLFSTTVILQLCEIIYLKMESSVLNVVYVPILTFPLGINSRFWMLPSLLLKKMIMGNFTTSKVDAGIADSIDFMVERVSPSNDPQIAFELLFSIFQNSLCIEFIRLIFSWKA